MDITSYLLGKKAGSGGTANLQNKSITITENGTTTVNPDTGYDGMKKVDVSVSGILDTSDANATSSDIALGKSGYVNGIKVNGDVPIGSSSMATNYASDNVGIYLDELKVDTTQGNRNQFFYTGDKISVLAPLSSVATVVGATAEKIKKDEVICGITGTYEAGGSSHDWSAIGYSSEPTPINDGYTYAKSIYDNWDSNITNYSSKYYQDYNLVYMPLVDTSKGTMFSSTFYDCKSLQYVPQIDTSKATGIGSMFSGCNSLKKVEQLDLSTAVAVNGMFTSCYSLTNLGGLKDLGKAYLTSRAANYNSYTMDLSASTLLTHDSLMNVINNLYDIATKGCNTQSLRLGATNLAKLSSAEIQIATDKGWTVS